MSTHDSADGTDHPATAPATAGPPGQHDRARQQTDEEFSAFYRAHIRHLVAFLIGHGAGVHTAADIAQEAMTDAYRNWTDITYPKAWVYAASSHALARRIAPSKNQSKTYRNPPTCCLALTPSRNGRPGTPWPHGIRHCMEQWATKGPLRAFGIRVGAEQTHAGTIDLRFQMPGLAAGQRRSPRWLRRIQARPRSPSERASSTSGKPWTRTATGSAGTSATCPATQPMVLTSDSEREPARGTRR
ncbi:RNA polymerase sigma factor [Streptomyces sp. NRRL S-1022]|uniref:RNA polymerase sigma factor n=1 Tax=Streptomyces sp. NRRL S-1022 TaxID=1463880 RepID=UPI000691D2B0|nr:hypothetical protein [Streptomyces sp. NRRL S-1022]